MGANFKFIHCSDLHLGSRFKEISNSDPELGKMLTESTFASFEKMIDTALNENVDLMVISGDVFDEENETPATRYRFSKEIERLKAPCFISLGNHDFKRSWETSIPLPSNAHVFPNEPETIVLDINNSKVEIVGRSFSSRHTSENLAASLRGSTDAFSIGVVHCSLDSSSDDDNYAPCKRSDLLGKGVDYWALGHIHKREIVYEHPHIVYPGNIQGRNQKESGEKGAFIVTVRSGTVSECRFVSTQKIIWQNISVDITDKDYNTLVDEIVTRSKRDSILSIEITGRGLLDPAIRLHVDEFTTFVSRTSGCIVSSVDVRTSPEMDLSSLEENSLFSKIVDSSSEFYSLSKEEIIDVICSTKLSSDIRHVFENMSEEEIRSLVHDAQMLILDMLSEDSQ